MLRRFAVFLSVAQSILFLGHYLLYQTLVLAFAPHRGTVALACALGVLSISFLGSSLLAFGSYHVVVRILYKIGAVWLGAFNYLFMAAVVWWMVFAASGLTGRRFLTADLSAGLFTLALAVGIYGLINGNWTRRKRLTVRLAGLPDSWRGRTIALVSDLHLGNIRGARFLARIVKKIAAENPSIVLIAGDLFDGTPIDADRAVAPLRSLQPPLGSFFVEGNHEEFRDPAQFVNAIAKTGVRPLYNELVDIEGLQVIGVPYKHATHADHLRSVLAAMHIARERASLLITHAPDHPEVAAEAGISLQVSGHTHLGQMFPYTLIARRIYREFTYGLSRIGGLQVYTSSGAGSWGPPQRVGTQSEIVLIRLE